MRKISKGFSFQPLSLSYHVDDPGMKQKYGVLGEFIKLFNVRALNLGKKNVHSLIYVIS